MKTNSRLEILCKGRFCYIFSHLVVNTNKNSRTREVKGINHFLRMSGKFKESEIEFFKEITKEELDINDLLTEKEYEIMNDHQERIQIFDFFYMKIYFCISM